MYHDHGYLQAKIVVPVPAARKKPWPECWPNKTTLLGHPNLLFFLSFSILCPKSRKIIELTCRENNVCHTLYALYNAYKESRLVSNPKSSRFRDARQIPLFFNDLSTAQIHQRPKYSAQPTKKGAVKGSSMTSMLIHSDIACSSKFSQHILQCDRTPPVYATPLPVDSYPAEQSIASIRQDFGDSPGLRDLHR